MLRRESMTQPQKTYNNERNFRIPGLVYLSTGVYTVCLDRVNGT